MRVWGHCSLQMQVPNVDTLSVSTIDIWAGPGLGTVYPATNTHLPGMAHQPVPVSQGSERHVRGPFARLFLTLHQNTEKHPSGATPLLGPLEGHHGGFSLGVSLSQVLTSNPPDFPWGLWSPCWFRTAQSAACGRFGVCWRPSRWGSGRRPEAKAGFLQGRGPTPFVT